MGGGTGSSGARDERTKRDDEPVSGSDRADADAPLKSILGADKPFACEDMAPAIDKRWLDAYVRGELSPDERADIRYLIANFRSWRDALDEALKRRPHVPRSNSPED